MINNSADNDFLHSLITGNKLKCTEIISNLLSSNVTIEDIFEIHIKKALYDIGEMWECGKIGVATEHLATAIVDTLLNELYSKVISNNKVNKTVVAACVENERHQIGIRMVADIFEMNGWNTFFLGANVLTKDLISFISDTKPDLIALSLNIDFHLPKIESIVGSIRNEFAELPIMLGGQAFRQGGHDALLKCKNVIYSPDVYRVEQFLKN